MDVFLGSNKYRFVMTQFKFKTSIKCNGCNEKVGPELNATHGIEKWEVDLTHPDRILTVEMDSDSDQSIVDSVKRVGFEIVSI